MDWSHFTLDHLIHRAAHGIEFEMFRYFLGTISTFVVIWLGLSHVLRFRKIRRPTPRARQIRSELLHSAMTVLVFVGMDIVIFDAADLGIFRQYSDIAQYGWPWFFASIALMIVAHDTYFYWAHRFMHLPRFYKLFHMRHHRSHNPTPFTAYSFAPLEAVVEYAFVPVGLMIIPIHETGFYIVMMIMIFKNAFAHCGYELMPKSWARLPVLGWLTSVTHHDMHHERASGNYGFYFTWWDRWMGTEHKNYLERFETAGDWARRTQADVKPETALVPAE